ncbi:MAG: AAA family ATPase [Patescibacteria group bacterium]|nr:AAA family ATPase [Patescibacteria group bacterium]
MIIKREPYTLLNIGENIWVIVLTGGPCSGKTSGLARLNRMLSDRGYKVLISPETATKLIGAGMSPGELPWAEFQEEILCDTLSQEQTILSIATRYRDHGRKVIVLCDRGAMDGEAYVGEQEFSTLIDHLGLTYSELCDERYHAVIHLRTAALGAEEFYTLDNNTARKETAEEARALDEKTLAAWTRHKRPRIIDNSTDFEGKIRRLFSEICAIIGDPVPLEKEDKFLIKSFDPATISVKWNESTIVQDYLVSPIATKEHRVRARTDGESTSYYYTVKHDISPGVRVEQEKMLTKREYESLLTLRNPNMTTIKKRRICFFWREQFFEVDLFQANHQGLVLLEAERTDRTPELELPPFIGIIRNVTNDKQYSNAELAKNGHLHNN